MTEFQELIQDAPNFVSMERGELVAYAYGMFAAGTKAEAENAKLKELLQDMNKWLWNGADCTECPFTAECDLNAAFESDLHSHVCIGWSEIHDRMRELGVEVDR